MATILDELADYARLRVEKAKAVRSAEEVKSLALAMPKGSFAFEKALKKTTSLLYVSARRLHPQRALSLRIFRILK